MSNDKSDKDGYPVLSTLREMLGLEGDAFVSAMKEAVWVPGGVDQLADMIIRSLSPDDQYRLARELPDVPEVMALVGRLLIALNEHPSRKSLGDSVLERAHKLGPKAVHYLSPYSWYPPIDKIRTILVSPYRLHAPSIVMRMQWGGEFEGIEAVWMIRFASGDLGEAYFVTEETDKAPLDEMPWMEITMDQALSLITSVGLVQSAVNNRFPFDGMTGVGLWMVLAGGREVAPWVDAVFALESEALSPEETALAEINALSAADYLAAYDLLDPTGRPEDVLQYINDQVEAAKTQGELWRLDAGPAEQESGRARVVLRAWYRSEAGLLDRAYEMILGLDADSHWRIQRMDVVAEEAVAEDQVAQYLANNPRYYTQLRVHDMEELADSMSGPPVSQSDGAVHFSSGPDFDYRLAYDIGASQDLTWTVVLDSDVSVVVWANNELLLRREVARLQEEGAAGDMLRSGVMDLFTLDQVQEAADNSSERLESLLESAARH